jgi:hypothetical protein
VENSAELPAKLPDNRIRKTRQISFTESCSLLKAGSEEKNAGRDYQFIDSLTAAQNAFIAAEEADALDRSGAKKRSGNEAAVLKYLQGFLDSFEEFGLSPENRKIIKAASELISRGGATGRLIRLILDIRKNSLSGHVALQVQARHLGEQLSQYIKAEENSQQKKASEEKLKIEEADFVLGEWLIKEGSEK